MAKVDVSIVIVSYNPVIEKLINTIKSAIVQKSIDFEIVVADDGSKDDFKEIIVEFFRDNNFHNYKLVFNKTNNGTVKNVISGLRVASGEYVYGISQGDYIFDEYAMSDYYSFAKQHNAKVCFGDYVGYSVSSGLKIHNDTLFPPITSVYGKKLKYYKTSFFLGGNILGASFFRERDFALRSFEYISKHSVYTEDGTSTAYALVNNIEVFYYPRKIVWYEVDSGITSSGNVWRKRINTDINNTYKALLKEHPNDRILDAGVMLTSYDMDEVNGLKVMLKVFLKHPVASIRKKTINRMPKRTIITTENDIAYLKNLIS